MGFILQILATAAALAFTLTFAGCNTSKGFGEDLQQLGEQIEESAEGGS